MIVRNFTNSKGLCNIQIGIRFEMTNSINAHLIRWLSKNADLKIFAKNLK